MIRRFLFLLCTVSPLLAQVDRDGQPDIQRRLELIERGQADAVKAELPALMTNFQNHPGVLYLQAMLTTDGTEAAKLYQNIVDNFPKSEWSDDALYKLYQYYYSIGLYKTGDQKIQQLRQEYPFSTYAVKTQSSEPSQQETPEPPAEIKSPGPVEKYPTSFTVQVGAFSTLQNAEELRAKFERENYSSNIFTIVSEGRKLHKVWVGEFQTYDDAKRFTAEIRKKFNLESIVVSR
ncbi:MAG: SPOR domain-containing protein [Ignavibacteriales bacterium]|nr:SPOR domain-containing protein [Ignavibacteriales bacterium]